MKTTLSRALWAFAITFALTPLAASAYQIGEDTPPGVSDTTRVPGDASAAGPIRLARFSYVRGNVTWRPGEGASWSPASVNLPIRQGAQIWVTDGGRAEVQFDDGSLLRLGNGAVSTLQTLYSDANGEFTEVQMNEGLSELELRGTESIYQVDTPFVSIKSEGPSKVRIGVDSSVEIAVREGRATVEGNGTKTTLNNGDYLNLPTTDAPYEVGSLPDPDSWDRFNEDRDAELADADSNLPPNIALVAGNLDSYGSWHDDPQYGRVWCPRVDDADWRPYQHGHWVWVEPFGWTWVSNEAWGWAPYHYGTWVSEPYGWGWCPGPSHQYWCPAVVHFSEYDGGIAWAPLAPREVHYPSVLSIGFRGGNWAAFFSIGGAAVYAPHNADYCEPRPFNNVTVNRVTYVNNVTNIYNTNIYNRTFGNTTGNRDVFVADNRFVPFNARHASGVTTASVDEFGGAGRYHPEAQGGAGIFTRGRSTSFPTVHPTALALTSSRSFLPDAHPSVQVQQRPVFRSALPGRVARFAPPLARSEAPAFRPGLMPVDPIPGQRIPSRGFAPAYQPRQPFGQPNVDQPRVNLPRVNQPSTGQPSSGFRGFDPGRAPSSTSDAGPRPFRGNGDQRTPVLRAAPSENQSYRYREATPLDSRPLTPRPEPRPAERPQERPAPQPRPADRTQNPPKASDDKSSDKSSPPQDTRNVRGRD